LAPPYPSGSAHLFGINAGVPVCVELVLIWLQLNKGYQLDRPDYYFHSFNPNSCLINLIKVSINGFLRSCFFAVIIKVGCMSSYQCCQMVYYQTKIPIWVNFGRSCNGRCWYFYVHIVYFTAEWYILWPFCTVCGNLVYVFPFLYVVPR
jgi:hypothetical protein